MWAFQAVVLVVLGVLAAQTVWVVYRAATAHGVLWGLRRCLLLGVTAALFLAGVWGWVRFQRRIPAGVTVAGVEASHAGLLARLRAAAREHDLEKLQGPEELSGPETRDLFAVPGILQASFVLPRGRIVRIHERPGVTGPRGYWAGEPSPGRPFLTRGWLVLQGANIDTLEYLESAVDEKGTEVTIHLTLPLESHLDARPR